MKFSIGSLRFERGKHLASLDGLRGLAILLVLLFHFTRLHSPLFRLGWVGVDLFFVLSGFLITGILIDTKSSEGYFKNFVFRRALRIFPLFYFALLVFTVLCIIVKTDYVQEFLGGRFFLSNAGWYWSYLVNWLMVREGHWPETAVFNHFWSLAIEEQFYLMWPLVVWIVSERQLLRICVGLIVIALVLRIAVFLAHANMITAYVATPFRLDALALGALVAICVRNQKYSELVSRIAIPVFLSGVIAVLAIVGLTRSMDNLHPLHATLGYSINAFLFGALLVICLARHSALKWFFESRVMLFLGKYSYSLYVFHVPVHYILATHIRVAGTLGFVIVFISSTILSVILSQLTWVLVERPFLKLKRFF